MKDRLTSTEVKKLIERIYRKRFFAKRIDITPDLLRLVEQAFVEYVPLKLFYLWGIHKREQMNKYDEIALSFLALFIEHVKNELSCPIDFTLVLSDVHARINEIPVSSINYYRDAIARWALEKKWNIRMLSDIWDNYGLKQNKIIEIAEEIPDESIDDLLLSFAVKYFTGSDKMIGAKRYYVARQMEKAIIEKEFGDSIHVTAADKRLLYLQPQLPHFQVWSLGKGRSNKPWFLNGK